MLASAAGLAAFAFAAGSPGPATLAVASTAMAGGPRSGLALALGLAAGLAFWGVLAGVGLGILIARFAPALLALKVAGAAYLLYLAWQSARSAAAGAPADAGRVMGAAGDRVLFLRGLWLNLLNPKAVLAWIAALALGAGGVLSVTLCALTGLLIYVVYATVFSLQPVMAAYRRAARYIEAAFAAFFAFAGLRLLFWRSAP